MSCTGNVAIQNRRRGLCLYDIVTMSLHSFNVCFQTEFVKAFTMGRSKAFFVFQDGLGSLLAKWLCQTASNSEGVFSLIFDERTRNH